MSEVRVVNVSPLILLGKVGRIDLISRLAALFEAALRLAGET